MTPKQEQLRDIIAAIARKPKSEIKPEHELVADLKLDSPMQLQLLMDVEEKLNVEVSDEEAARMTKVADILAHVEKS